MLSSDSIQTAVLGSSQIVGNRGAGIRHEGSGNGSNLSLHVDSVAPGNRPLIYNNVGLAVDLGTPGPTLNSSLTPGADLSVSAHAIITSATYANGVLDITGTNSIDAGYFLQFYGTRPTVSGRGQGLRPVGPVGLFAGMSRSAELSGFLSLHPDLEHRCLI